MPEGAHCYCAGEGTYTSVLPVGAEGVEQGRLPGGGDIQDLPLSGISQMKEVGHRGHFREREEYIQRAGWGWEEAGFWKPQLSCLICEPCVIQMAVGS